MNPLSTLDLTEWDPALPTEAAAAHTLGATRTRSTARKPNRVKTAEWATSLRAGAGGGLLSCQTAAKPRQDAVVPPATVALPINKVIPPAPAFTQNILQILYFGEPRPECQE